MSANKTAGHQVQYLRNGEGRVSMMPLIGWHHEGFDGGLLVQLQFAKSPEELAKGDLGVVQLAVSPEQAIDFADDLMRMANRVLALQERKTARA